MDLRIVLVFYNRSLESKSPRLRAIRRLRTLEHRRAAMSLSEYAYGKIKIRVMKLNRLP
jgi:hypothetical protein